MDVRLDKIYSEGCNTRLMLVSGGSNFKVIYIILKGFFHVNCLQFCNFDEGQLYPMSLCKFSCMPHIFECKAIRNLVLENFEILLAITYHLSLLPTQNSGQDSICTNSYKFPNFLTHLNFGAQFIFNLGLTYIIF